MKAYKVIAPLIMAVSLVGCAHGGFKIVEVTSKDGVTTKTTKGSATTFFDSQSALANFTASQTSTNGQNASLGSLNQQASGSNAVSLVDGAVAAAVSAAVKSAK